MAEKPYICAEMAAHNELGKWGEAEAAEYLRRHGYVIRDTDWRFGKRDLDIVAVTEDAQCLVFVEVKTRKSDKVQTPRGGHTPEDKKPGHCGQCLRKDRGGRFPGEV